MCGIVGFLDKTHNAHAAVGSVLFAMLRALRCRGPDSAGVALYGSGHAGDLVERDEVVTEALGADYAAYYLQVKREEWQSYHQSVSRWETDTYLGVY